MLKLLELVGFQAHKRTSLDLDPGVNIVVGPTDSGKSALIRALSWLNFNRPTGDAFVNKASDVCQVRVVTDDGEAIRRKKPKNEYVINDDTLGAVGRTVPEDLAKVLDLGEVNFQNQLAPYFLVLESPGAISRYITELLGLDTVDRSVKLVRSQVSQLKKTVESKNAQLEISQKEVEKLSDVDTWVSFLDETRADSEGFDVLVAHRAELQEIVLDTLECRVKLDKTTEALEKSDLTEIEALMEKLTPLSAEASELRQLIVSVTKCDEELTVAREAYGKVDLTGIQTLMEELAPLREGAAVLKEGIADWELAQENYEVLADKLSESSIEIENARDSYVGYLKTLGVCPTCFTEFKDSAMDAILEKL